VLLFFIFLLLQNWQRNWLTLTLYWLLLWVFSFYYWCGNWLVLVLMFLNYFLLWNLWLLNYLSTFLGWLGRWFSYLFRFWFPSSHLFFASLHDLFSFLWYYLLFNNFRWAWLFCLSFLQKLIGFIYWRLKSFVLFFTQINIVLLVFLNLFKVKKGTKYKISYWLLYPIKTTLYGPWLIDSLAIF
jgi:hypothetical protein